MPDVNAITAAIRDLTAARGPAKSICPSEVARLLGGDDWRDLMPAVRDAAAELSDAGDVRVTRGGEPVDPRNPCGPIRIQMIER